MPQLNTQQFRNSQGNTLGQQAILTDRVMNRGRKPEQYQGIHRDVAALAGAAIGARMSTGFDKQQRAAR